MACSITITSLSAVDPEANPPTALRVEGTATQCGRVRVSVVCDVAGVPSVAEVGTFAAGFWIVDIPITTNTLCLCGSAVTVHAECVTDPTCFVDQVMTIQCGDDCPIITDIAATPSTICNADGTRTVSFSATVTDTTGVVTIVNWEYESGVFTSAGLNVAAGATTPIQTSYDYKAGIYTATLHTVYPEGCPDKEVEVVVDECAPPCLDASGVSVTVGGCDANGNRLVTFSFDPPLTGDIDFGAISLPPENGVISMGGKEQYYPPPGPYTATITPDGCPPIQVEVGPLDTCLPGVPTGACCLPNNQCADMSQAECVAAGGTYMGDGTSCATTNCGTGPPPPPPPPVPGCAQLLWIAVIALLAGGPLVSIGLCTAIVLLLELGVVLIIVGVLAFLLWLLLCSKTTACAAMQAVQCVLFWMEAVVLPAVALLVWLIVGLPCAVTLAVPALLWGAAYAWLVAYMGKVNCTTTCP